MWRLYSLSETNPKLLFYDFPYFLALISLKAGILLDSVYLFLMKHSFCVLYWHCLSSVVLDLILYLTSYKTAILSYFLFKLCTFLWKRISQFDTAASLNVFIYEMNGLLYKCQNYNLNTELQLSMAYRWRNISYRLCDHYTQRIIRN